jgi:hypothetical protein
MPAVRKPKGNGLTRVGTASSKKTGSSQADLVVVEEYDVVLIGGGVTAGCFLRDLDVRSSSSISSVFVVSQEKNLPQTQDTTRSCFPTKNGENSETTPQDATTFSHRIKFSLNSFLQTCDLDKKTIIFKDKNDVDSNQVSLLHFQRVMNLQALDHFITLTHHVSLKR